MLQIKKTDHLSDTALQPTPCLSCHLIWFLLRGLLELQWVCNMRSFFNKDHVNVIR